MFFTCVYPILTVIITIVITSVLNDTLLLFLLALCPIYIGYYLQIRKNYGTSVSLIRMILIVTRNLQSIFLFNFIVMGLHMAFVALWSRMLESSITRYERNSLDSVQFAFIILYLVRIHFLKYRFLYCIGRRRFLKMSCTLQCQEFLSGFTYFQFLTSTLPKCLILTTLSLYHLFFLQELFLCILETYAMRA